MKKYLTLRSTKILVKIILGIIIISLILSTMNSYINYDVERYIAKVNGQKISFKSFQNMYLIEREKQKKILGKKFTILSNDKKFINNTYNYVLSQLINNVLLEQYIKKLHLQIDDQKIKKILLKAPIFQENNKFNKEKYFNYIASINLTNREYIDMIKTKINTDNFIDLINKSNFILENEQNNIIKLLSQKRIIQKSIINFSSLIDKQNISDIEAKNYFSKNKNHFYIPEKFKIRFVQLRPSDFKTQVNNQEINEWYLKNIEKYSSKEKRKYSVHQTKTKNEALLILSQLHDQPENFSKIAKEKSIDPISSKKNGDIGWMSVDLIPDEIKKANLNKKDQISSVIPFRNEFLIIQLKNIIPKKSKKIHEVYNIIKQEIKNQKSLHLYHKLTNKISEMIKQNPNQFDFILKNNNITVKETDWFDKNSIPKILNIPILKKIIFSKNLVLKETKFKLNSHFVIFKNNTSFLFNIKDVTRKKMQNFEYVKKNIIKKLKIVKAIKEAKYNAENIINELQQGNMNLFKKYNLSFNDSEIMSRYDNNPITSIVFSLPHPTKEKKIYTLYQDKNKNFIIIFLKKIYHENFSDQEKGIILEYLEKYNTEMIFNAILKDIRANAIIQYEK